VASGWQPSDLVIIAARPSMGKTAFVLSMTRNMAVNHNQPIALFSLEMSSVQLVNRLIASETELGSEKIRNGKLSEEEWQQLHSKIKALIKAPIYVDDTPALSIFELRAKCRRLQQRYGIKVLIIDYLQLMTAGADMRGNREQEVSMISRQLKIIAKELNIPVIALSQLNRGVEQRTGDAKKPMLSDLRESGAIEQDADMVLFIHRPERYGIMEDSMGNSLKGIADIIIAKHRNGAVGEIQLRFRNELAQFCDLEEVSPFASGGSTVKTVTFGSRMNEDAAPQMPQLDSDFQEGGKSFENPANSSKAPF
jgi:replicative DNA helicase